MDNKENLFQYYKNLDNYYGNYHHHKEISAWAGLVLHILFNTFIILTNTTSKFDIWIIISFSLGLLLESIILLIYVNNQLELKDDGGALAEASKQIIIEIINIKSDNEINKYLEIRESTDTMAKYSHVLPQYLLNKKDIIETKGRKRQDTTKLMIKLLLILTSILVLIIKWLAFFK